MNAIHTANIDVDRKILAEMAVNDEAAFSALVKQALDAAPLPPHGVSPAGAGFQGRGEAELQEVLENRLDP